MAATGTVLATAAVHRRSCRRATGTNMRRVLIKQASTAAGAGVLQAAAMLGHCHAIKLTHMAGSATHSMACCESVSPAQARSRTVSSQQHREHHACSIHARWVAACTHLHCPHMQTTAAPATTCDTFVSVQQNQSVSLGACIKCRTQLPAAALPAVCCAAGVTAQPQRCGCVLPAACSAPRLPFVGSVDPEGHQQRQHKADQAPGVQDDGVGGQQDLWQSVVLVCL